MAQELGDLDDLGDFARLEAELAETLAEEDVLKFGEVMAPGSLGAVLVFENVWAARFGSAVRHAGGQLIANGRYSRPGHHRRHGGRRGPHGRRSLIMPLRPSRRRQGRRRDRRRHARTVARRQGRRLFFFFFARVTRRSLRCRRGRRRNPRAVAGREGRRRRRGSDAGSPSVLAAPGSDRRSRFAPWRAVARGRRANPGRSSGPCPGTCCWTRGAARLPRRPGQVRGLSRPGDRPSPSARRRDGGRSRSARRPSSRGRS